MYLWALLLANNIFNYHSYGIPKTQNSKYNDTDNTNLNLISVLCTTYRYTRKRRFKN